MASSTTSLTLNDLSLQKTRDRIHAALCVTARGVLNAALGLAVSFGTDTAIVKLPSKLSSDAAFVKVFLDEVNASLSALGLLTDSGLELKPSESGRYLVVFYNVERAFKLWPTCANAQAIIDACDEEAKNDHCFKIASPGLLRKAFFQLHQNRLATATKPAADAILAAEVEAIGLTSSSGSQVKGAQFEYPKVSLPTNCECIYKAAVLNVLVREYGGANCRLRLFTPQPGGYLLSSPDQMIEMAVGEEKSQERADSTVELNKALAQGHRVGLAITFSVTVNATQ